MSQVESAPKMSDADGPLPRAARFDPTDPPVRWRELLAVVLLVALADLTIYRGHGFAGWAALLVLAPLLLVLGMPKLHLRRSVGLIAAMLLVLSLRMIWLGSALGAVTGLALLITLAVTLQGRRPQLGDVIASSIESLAMGGMRLGVYVGHLLRFGPKLQSGIVMPLAALVLFSGLFVLANPDLVTRVVTLARDFADAIQRWLGQVPFGIQELLFWVGVAWLSAGLFRTCRKSVASTASRSAPPAPAETTSDWYVPVRNTLASVIVLFAVYLTFEFSTLWFRTFPQGFYYAGYAHEGAAWLTTALAFATLMLSLMFRGKLLHDPRIGRLRGLAWVWSGLNLLLALTVYHRLHIYIDFNGMTRMRTVALFGTSVVVVGFALVVWKIAQGYDFAWLVRNQLWALACTIFLFAITPVDALVHRYNVRQIMAGDLAPAVQITEHPVNSEGIMMLLPLTDCPDATIKAGIRAMLAERYLRLESELQQRQSLGWTSHQLADTACWQLLQKNRNRWDDHLDDAKRSAAWRQFREYAYQWY